MLWSSHCCCIASCPYHHLLLLFCCPLLSWFCVVMWQWAVGHVNQWVVIKKGQGCSPSCDNIHNNDKQRDGHYSSFCCYITMAPGFHIRKVSACLPRLAGMKTNADGDHVVTCHHQVMQHIWSGLLMCCLIVLA